MTAIHAADWHGSRRAMPAIALAGICVAAAMSPVGDDSGTTLCPYRFVTGGWCPGCGGTRAVRSIVRADLAGALTLNPWAVLVLAQAALVVTAIAAAPAVARNAWTQHGNKILAINAAIAVAAWIARMATGTIPTPF